MNRPDAEIQSLLQRAAILRLLAAGLDYPDATLRSHMLESLARFPRHNAETAILFETLAPAWAAVNETSLIEDYSRLFIGGNAIVPRESAHTNTGRSAVLADLGGFYLAFGFDLREDRREALDHLGMELEFYSLLLIRQSYALDQDWPEQVEISRDAAGQFLTDHLGRWAGEVYREVEARQAAPAYRVLLAGIVALVARECRLLGVRPAPLSVRGPDVLQEDSFVCPQEHPYPEYPDSKPRDGTATVIRFARKGRRR